MTTWEPVDPDTLSTAEVVAYLRARCPWAAAHTHASLAPYLLEETYELLDAIEEYTDHPSEEARDDLIGELGDVAYQVLFHAAVLDQPNSTPTSASEPTGEYVNPHAITEVSERLKQKVVRRHPHVFTTTGPVGIDQVERAYEQIKAQERAEAVVGNTEQSPEVSPVATAMASIPVSMPALARAQAVLGRLDRLDLGENDLGRGNMSNNEEGDHTTEECVGDELLALVRKAYAHGIDAEGALRRATDAYIRERGSHESTDAH